MTKRVQPFPIIQCTETVLVLTKPSETPRERTRIGSWQSQLKHRQYLSSKHSNGMMWIWPLRIPPTDEPRSLIPKRTTVQPFARHPGPHMPLLPFEPIPPFDAVDANMWVGYLLLCLSVMESDWINSSRRSSARNSRLITHSSPIPHSADTIAVRIGNLNTGRVPVLKGTLRNWSTRK